MAYRTLDLNLLSARDLKDVNLFSKMEVYAIVSISSDPRSQQRTPTDREGSRNPSWNSTFRFTIPADAGAVVLRVLLRAERALGDRDVGEVQVPLKELLSNAGDGPTPTQFASYQVRRPSSGKSKGVLNFSYKLGERFAAGTRNDASMTAYPTAAAAAKPYLYPAAPYPPSAGKPARFDGPVTAYPTATATPTLYPPEPYPPSAGKPARYDEPVTAYPAAATSSHAPYPPQPAYGYQGYQQPLPHGYAPPPQPGYGYATPSQSDYGYGYQPQVVKPQKKKNNFGMGLGAGLLGGALGGVLIGDMIADDNAYDAGYDAGFDDGGFDGGFDF